ncbi:cytochrome c oxidase subunit CcoM [Marinobacteraceae bacterium S3BR75-40.1]
MYVDSVVIAGVVTVLLMVAFFGGVGLFIYKDSHKRKKKQGH